MSTAPLTPKPHYLILDSLRGVAAIFVVIFHLLEAHATSHLDLMLNHGYLAVDFFFLLSGYVIGYAYDDRWNSLSIGEFFKRRLIRLQPMVIVGMLAGAACFYFQDSVLWPNISEVSIATVVLIMFIGMLMIPVPVSLDIRGWWEMYPLNGPAWSLFFEYIANILYAVGIRKLSNTALAILVAICAGVLANLAIFGEYGDLIGGWSLAPSQLYIGLTRVMFPFFAGLLLSRTVKLKYVSNAFLWCSLLVVAVLAFPRIGGEQRLWMNGVYDSVSVILLFPFIVWLGASGEVRGKFTTRLCKFLGDISYPIYITHYPIIYIYTGWVHDNQQPKIQDTWLIAFAAFLCAILLAYLSLKLYDEPVRKWLSEKFLLKKRVAIPEEKVS